MLKTSILRRLPSALQKTSKRTTTHVAAGVAIVSAGLILAASSNEREAVENQGHDRKEVTTGLLDTQPDGPAGAFFDLQQWYEDQGNNKYAHMESLTNDGEESPSFRKALQRHNTIRRLELHRNKENSLESRYSINWKAKPLGVGAFGAVYLATDRSTKEPVALKNISKKFTDQESFQREIRALLLIRSAGGHPNICALRENFDCDGNYALILDFIGGGEMFDHLADMGAYSEADAARLVREVASALAFLHGIGVVHADLKPENLMMSTSRRSDAVVKLVDFGSSDVLYEDDIDQDNDSMMGKHHVGLTPAYCPPESFLPSHQLEPAVDCWSLGVILYIMLTGLHPYDMTGNSTDEDVVYRIKNPRRYRPPIRDATVTRHLSESAISLMEQLMHRDPKKRLTASEMLEHPWVRGETAKKDIIAGSAERLHSFRVFKTKLQRKFFEDAVAWSDHEEEDRRRSGLVERSFRSFDSKMKGYLTETDLGKELGDGPASSGTKSPNTNEDDGISLTMSDFQHVISENMKNRYFPKGHVVYHEGEIGNHMYFINSGSIEVVTKDGSVAIRKQGDFFGEGALLDPKKIRSATIKCKTPVHAMEISREYFEKYLESSESGLVLTLREKDKIRKRNRAKAILRMHKGSEAVTVPRRGRLFKPGEKGDYVYILEEGKVDILVGGKRVFHVTPGNVFGEHALLTNETRNTAAVCTSDSHCSVYRMYKKDFFNLTKKFPSVRNPIVDLSRRREFKKAVVFRIRREFPYDHPRKAFDAVDTQNKGILDIEDVASLLRAMNPNYTDEEVREVFRSLDLLNTNIITFDEFKKVFIADIRTSASM